MASYFHLLRFIQPALSEQMLKGAQSVPIPFRKAWEAPVHQQAMDFQSTRRPGEMLFVPGNLPATLLQGLPDLFLQASGNLRTA